jgi:hypothetical protein
MQIFSLSPPVAATPWPALYAPVFGAGAVLIVGVIAASIAWRQWQTAKTKLQLDLYDKRRPVFTAARDLILCVSNDYSETLFDTWQTFHAMHAEAGFLYGPEVADYLEGLRVRVSDRRGIEYERRKIPREPDELDDVSGWKGDELAKLTEAFRPYLQLEGRRNSL